MPSRFRDVVAGLGERPAATAVDDQRRDLRPREGEVDFDSLAPRSA
jgi:hypothetical protein